MKNDNPIKIAVSELGGNARFAKILGEYAPLVSHRTVYAWKTRGFIPYRYRLGIQRVIEAYGVALSDPDGLLAATASGQTFGIAYFPNAEFTKWVNGVGGISHVLFKLNRQLVKEASDPFIKPKAYINMHNWLKRGRVPHDIREAFIAIGCPPRVLDAPLALLDQEGYEERRKLNQERLAREDRERYDAAMDLPYPTAASLAAREGDDAEFVNPLGDE